MVKLVSIIIPIYNGENCMQNAVESAIAQTYKNIEIILINDGSTDDTEKIAQEYACMDDRIVLYNQCNSGPAVARNVGLKLAKGEYVQFLDSDDFLDKDAINITLREFEECPDASFLIFGFNIYKKGKLIRTPNPGNHIYRPGDKFQDFLPINNLLASPGNKLYKKECIFELFDKRRKFAEDKIFNYANLNKNTIIKSIDKCFYNVCLDTENSVNKRYKKGKALDFLYCGQLEEKKLFEIFPNEFDSKQHRIKTLSSLGFILSGMVNNLPMASIKDELKDIMEFDYFNLLIKNIGEIRFYNKILFFLIKKRAYYLLKIYCGFAMKLYRLIKK